VIGDANLGAIAGEGPQAGAAKPVVSVVIPTFDRRDMAAVAVESVLSQTFGDFELVVVDDGSTDGTAVFLRKEFPDPRLRVIVQENRGASAARNRGVDGTTGRWVAFLDSDDSWLPRKLERQLEELRLLPDVPACYTRRSGTGAALGRTPRTSTPNTRDGSSPAVWPCVSSALPPSSSGATFFKPSAGLTRACPPAKTTISGSVLRRVIRSTLSRSV